MHVNLPEKDMLGEIAERNDASDSLIQVHLPVDDESMSSHSRGSNNNLAQGEAYLKELARGRD